MPCYSVCLIDVVDNRIVNMRGVSTEVASQHVYKSTGLDRDSVKSPE